LRREGGGTGWVRIVKGEERVGDKKGNGEGQRRRG